MNEIYQSPNPYPIYTLRIPRLPKNIFGSGGLTLMERWDPQIPPNQGIWRGPTVTADEPTHPKIILRGLGSPNEYI